MRNRTLSISLLSAGLMLGGFVLPTARAEDAPKTDSTPKTEQPAAKGEGRQGFPILERVRSAVDELKLSDEQKGKVNGYFEEAKTQLKKIREDAAGDREAMMKKSREVFEKLRENIGSILTDEQKEQLKTKMQGALQRGGEAGGRLKENLEKLNLSDEQKEKIHGIMEDVAAKAKALREGGGEASREKVGELLKDAREKIMNILTDDQKEKFKELQSQGGGQEGRPHRAETKPDPK